MSRTITLSPRSSKGKARIDQHGSRWLVHTEADNSLRSGWLFLKSIETGEWRWVRAAGDQNFDIIN